MARFTPIQLKVLEAAYHGDAGNARDIENRRIRTRTINALTADGLLYSPNIDGRRELTPKGREAYLAEQVSA
jgi:hypothetical protein